MSVPPAVAGGLSWMSIRPKFSGTRLVPQCDTAHERLDAFIPKSFWDAHARTGNGSNRVYSLQLQGRISCHRLTHTQHLWDAQCEINRGFNFSVFSVTSVANHPYSSSSVRS